MVSFIPQKPINKISVLNGFFLLLTLVIVSRLFYLQVIQYTFYQKVAAKEHYGVTEIPARRGEIFLKDYHSGEFFRVATNTTLDLVYADPTLIKNPVLVTDTFSPLLFNLEEERGKNNKRLEEERKNLDHKLTEEEKEKILKPASDEELKAKFYQDLLQEISQQQRKKIIITQEADKNMIGKLQAKNITGIEIQDQTVTAYPPRIPDQANTAKKLAEILGGDSDYLEKILKGQNRYVVLQRKLSPEISQKIRDIIKKDKNKDFTGIGLKEEYYRLYPEKSLAANIIGYVSNQGIGQYGLERKFNTQLAGEKGIFETQKDSIGRQITVGQSVIKPPEDGDDIILTIDRTVQAEIEKLLEKKVKNTRADGGQVIIIEPTTGRIIAMAHYPTFDPNNYSEVFKKEEIALTEEEIKALKPIDENEGRYWLYVNKDTGERIQIFKETAKDGKAIYKRYKNMVGPEAYHNKAVAWGYEPGSVFKAIAMSAAIDDGDVKPSTMFNDSGPIKVDEYEIHNATDRYYGLINMTTVLGKSLNTGMTFVARKMGRTLFYSYIKKFGFGERTDIEFDDEEKGKIEHFTKWAESELVTKAFGQGLTATPLQMAAAYATIANKGVLMQPYIVEEIHTQTGRVIKTDPHPIRQVVSENTAATVTAMLISAVENGVARNAQVPGHYLAGKTGTAQTYFKGKPLKGAGTTIANVIGFAPIDNPRFVILIKLDKPRSSEWADATAAPLFSEIAGYLFNYFNIPPDKK